MCVRNTVDEIKIILMALDIPPPAVGNIRVCKQNMDTPQHYGQTAYFCEAMPNISRLFRLLSFKSGVKIICPSEYAKLSIADE